MYYFLLWFPSSCQRCTAGSASLFRSNREAGASKTVRSQAEPGNEPLTCQLRCRFVTVRTLHPHSSRSYNMIPTINRPCVAAMSLASLLLLTRVPADETVPDPSLLTIDRIYQANEFDEKSYSARWLDRDDTAAAYTTLETSREYSGRHDIVRHDAASGDTTVMVSASDLVPAGETTPLKIDDYHWSKNHDRLLIYTNSKRVWRQNTRGDYWLLDRSSRQLKKLGGDVAPSAMMFAKLSPDWQESRLRSPAQSLRPGLVGRHRRATDVRTIPTTSSTAPPTGSTKRNLDSATPFAGAPTARRSLSGKSIPRVFTVFHSSTTSTRCIQRSAGSRIPKSASEIRVPVSAQLTSRRSIPLG